MENSDGVEIKSRGSKLVVAILFVGAVLFAGIVAGCEKNKPAPVPIRESVDRIMMHEPGRYTFFVERPDGSVAQLILTNGCGSCGEGVTIMRDVPSDERMWVEYSCGSNGYPTQCKQIPTGFSYWSAYPAKIVIHIHGLADINGAGWDHGKFGRGQTTVVE